eukprot:8821003-Ditylum_brightwellii.AAC.2
MQFKSGDGNAQCYHCDEKDHTKNGCPHKDTKWYEVPPKNNSCKRMYCTEYGSKLVTHGTTCDAWNYDSTECHLAKNHTQYNGSAKKFYNKRKKKLRSGADTHANHVVPEDDASDSGESTSASVAAFGWF